MDVVIALVVFGALVVIILRLQSAISLPLDALRVRMKRHVLRRRDYSDGLRLISYQLVFYSEWDIDDLREGILAKIQPESTLPALKSGFAIETSSDDFIVFVCGNRINEFFKGTLTLTRSGIGVEGSWAFTSWLRHDGIVAALEPMKQIIRHIHSGVLNVDPGATFGLAPMQRTPRVAKTYDLPDTVHVDYVQDHELGLTAVSHFTIRDGLVGDSQNG